MIIGIDESGTFDLKNDKENLFVGVHLLNIKAYKKLDKRLNKWKNKNKYLKNSNGEIKGSNIKEEKIFIDFILGVVKPIKYFYITFVETIPSIHKKRDIQFHRDHHLKGLREGIWKCKKVNNDKLARELEEESNWYQKLNYQSLLKTWILSEMICYSFRMHVIKTILDNQDKTLGEIKIEIDRDFVRQPRHILFWKDFLRNKLYSYTYQKPILIISEWSEDHPFFLAKNKNQGERFNDVNHIFRNNCNFLHSHQSPLIQVSDIISTIIYNYLNYNKFERAFDLLKQFFIFEKSKPILRLRMTTPEVSKPNPAPNPYLKIKGD